MSIFEEFADIFKHVKITFSKNCRSGLLNRCECWRCRKKRGDPVTDESESLAEKQAVAADRKQRKRLTRFLGSGAV